MRDLLRHLTTAAGPGPAASDEEQRAFRRDREHVNVMLNEELERYAAAHGIELGKESKVGDGFLYGGGPKGTDVVVFFRPSTNEIGAMERRRAEGYLRTGEKQ